MHFFLFTALYFLAALFSTLNRCHLKASDTGRSELVFCFPTAVGDTHFTHIQWIGAVSPFAPKDELCFYFEAAALAVAFESPLFRFF